MYSSVQLARKYVDYYVTASNGKGHGMHSPFVFNFILHVLNNKSKFAPPTEMEALRKALLSDKHLLEIEDFGAGSRVAKTKQRTVAQLAKAALKPKKYAQLLYRLVAYYKPETILELGTSLGVTTSYLAAANPAAAVLTIEGSKAVAAVASENFAKLQSKNIRQMIGNFDDLLPSAISALSSIDLAYIDGNHRYGPTVNYFTQLLPALHNNSILVFDDIHWSEEMEKAWEEIKKHPSVQCSVDIFFLGFVFFRKEFKVPQHFTVRF
ncbi:class I SAM-dependent methyltransferase [Flavisolibacter sp. BT320]|nr:class I SAM-dependent methyltransferase [Flavisolibacter longurius]